MLWISPRFLGERQSVMLHPKQSRNIFCSYFASLGPVRSRGAKVSRWRPCKVKVFDQTGTSHGAE